MALTPSDCWEGVSSTVILEMPHLTLSLPSGEQMEVDPELEHIKTLDNLVYHFKRLLSGEPIPSRTREGITYRLKSTEESKAFMSEISEYLTMFLKFRFKTTLDEFLSLLRS